MFMIGTMGFGVTRVNGRSRVPSPPTRTIACNESSAKDGPPGSGRGDLSSCHPRGTSLRCPFQLRTFHDWSAVQGYYDAGHDRDACRQRFGFQLDAWYKAIRRGQLRARLQRQKLIDWPAVQRYSDEGHTVCECRARFGFSGGAWTKAVRRGVIRPRPLAIPLDVILRRARSRCNIKRRLLMAGLLSNRCEACGIRDWRGKPLSIQIDHINGIRDDYRLENLRMLCPNCHSQTETFAGRNSSQGKSTRQDKSTNSFPGSSNGRTAASGAAYRSSSL